MTGKNQKTAGQALRVSAVAVDVLSARSDVHVLRKRTFKFFEGLDKLKLDDR